MIDLVYIAWNRLEFTQYTFACLINHTDWNLVRTLTVYDDGSTDGTRQHLEHAIQQSPAPYVLYTSRLGSCVAAMDNFIRQPGLDDEDLFAVVENDLAVPPGWLNDLNDLMEATPGLQLLGTEPCFAGMPGDDWDGEHRVMPFSHIGGSGLMRRSAFKDRPRFPTLGFTGFEIWQSQTKPRLGWIQPDIRVCLLDRVPFDPWKTLSEKYIAAGWQRPWSQLPEQCAWHYEWTLP